jgi:hypothetical protein
VELRGFLTVKYLCNTFKVLPGVAVIVMPPVISLVMLAHAMV